MKVIIERDALAPVLDALVRVVDRKAVIPVLTCLKLETGGAGLLLSAHALDSCMQIEVRAEVSDAGAIAVEAEPLRAIVRGLNAGAQIRLSVSDARLTIQAGRSRYNLAILPADDFPPMLAPGADAARIALDAAQVTQVLTRPSGFTAESDDRPFFGGVWLNIKDGALWGCGLNGKIMLALNIGMPDGCAALLTIEDAEHSTIIPASATDGISRALAAGGALVIDRSTVCAEGASGTYACKLLSYKFPNAWAVLPQRLEDEAITLDRAELASALARLSSLTTKENRVLFRWSQGEEDVVICLDGATWRGDGEERLALRSPAGSDGSCILSQVYLAKILSAMRGDMVEISHNIRSSSVRLHDTGEPEAMFALSTIRPRKLEDAEDAA